DVNDEGQVLVYASNRELGDALVARISSMTKEVEVGDEFTGKVVKTTTFGAFVELAKGTDGLLHISNVAPGRRIDTVEEVLNKGDELAVKVVEVDRERGRIGLRLAEDPEVQGKNPEELRAIAAAEGSRGRPERGPRDRDRGGRDRGGRDRDRGPRDGNGDRGPRDGDGARVRDRDPDRA
ncbi:MAG: S1 RNA-binding domain-containing protein, partial [Solirubrobacteraceae bacterium]